MFVGFVKQLLRTFASSVQFIKWPLWIILVRVLRSIQNQIQPCSYWLTLTQTYLALLSHFVNVFSIMKIPNVWNVAQFDLVK